MAYVNHYAMSVDASDSGFLRRLATSLAKLAGFIQSEATSTAYHGQRQALAHRVSLDPMGHAQRVALVVIEANADLQTASDAGGVAGPWTPDDADVDDGVSASWNLLAGVAT